MKPVTDRRSGILRLVVRDYIETAAPVGSKTIHDKYGVAASPATIRHEMQALEEEGLLIQPHTSAGRVPSDRGYRVFVESLMGQMELPAEEQATIRHQFYQAPPELDAWVDLAAGLLARSLGLLAVVVPPRSRELRVRQLELINLNDLLVLLVVVLREPRVLKQLVTLHDGMDQEALSQLAQRLNANVAGKRADELPETLEDESSDAVLHSLRRMLEDESARGGDAHVEGLGDVLTQPEFESDHQRVLEILSLVDGHSMLDVVPPATLDEGGVSVMIGAENAATALHDCSVVVAPYGTASERAGFVGLVGPTRMPYGRSVASVRYFSDLLQEMMEQVYG